MSLSVSPVNNMNNSVSFGMAKFSDEGMRLAQSSTDTYEALGSPTEFVDPKFFDKKGMFSCPFKKYFDKNKGSQEGINDIKSTIVSCGASKNAYSNSKFIKQLLTVEKSLDKLPEEDRKEVSKAVAIVFDTNWNNPRITKEETMALLDMSCDALEDNAYVTLTGVIERSDAAGPKVKKTKKTFVKD